MEEIKNKIEALKPFYIYGRPIETPIGKLRFLTVGEWYDFVVEGYLSALLMEKQELEAKLKPLVDLDDGVKTIFDILQQSEYFAFLFNIGVLIDDGGFDLKSSYIYMLGIAHLYEATKKMLEFCFGEDVFNKISNQEEFDFYRDLIVETNCISHEKPNPNPEIEKFNKLKRLMNKNKGHTVDWESMYTSVGLEIGKDPDEMTLYKFHKYFARIAQFKNYDRSVLYSVVSDNKVEPWYQAIEDKKEELQTISEDKLKSGNMDSSLANSLLNKK